MSTSKLFFLFLALIGAFFSGCNRHEKAEVKKAKIGDIELAYYTRGSGEPLVMIMGFRGTMAIWDPALLETLEKKYKLILFDNRGAGLSTDSEKVPLTISQMAEDTAALIKLLGYQKAHVLGWSMGTRIALELAFKFPEVVESLILCSPNPGGKYQTKRKTDAFEKLISENLSQQEGLSLIFPDTTAGNKASVEFIARLTKAILLGTTPNDLNISKQTIERQVQALKLWGENNHIYDMLPTIKVPTLVAGGLSDVLDSPENVKTVACRIPFAWTAYFANSGHYFISQDHRNFAKLVIVFLESGRSSKN